MAPRSARGLGARDETDDPTEAQLREVARFDSHPESNLPEYNGARSVYPFLPSGTASLNDVNRGLFILGLRPPR